MKLLSLFSCITIILIINTNIKSQNLDSQFRPYNGLNNGIHTYGNVTDFPSNAVADDFGPRQLNSPTNGYDEYQWHGGIDYNSTQSDGNNDEGDLILAVENGSISEHGVIRNGTKYIAITSAPQRNYRYIHIFSGGNVNQMMTEGGTIVKFMDAPFQNNWAIIFQINGVYSAISSVEMGVPTPDDPNPATPTVTFINDTGNQLTLNTTNLVNIGSPIAPLGTSSNYSAHCHTEILTQLINNNGQAVPPGHDNFAKDPLEHIAHDIPNFNGHINFYLQDDMNQGISLNYPGTNASTIQVRVELPPDAPNNNPNDPANRYDFIMNIDKVEVFIKKSFEDNDQFLLINGPNFESQFSLGARSNTQRINMPLNIANANVGLWNTTHMQPFAYAGVGAPYTHHRYEEFYFADFSTRVHQYDPMGNPPHDYAVCPMNTRYNDGQYNFKANVTNVRNTDYPYIMPDLITIDNFQPFVQQASARINGKLVYDMLWSCNDVCGGGIEPTGGPIPDVEISETDILIGGMEIEILASEPLQTFGITTSIFGQQVMPADITLISTSVDNRTRIYQINNLENYLPPTSSGGENDISFTFTGEDYPAPNNDPNPLLNLSEFYDPYHPENDNICLSIPIRIDTDNDENDWQNPNNVPNGQEEAHHFSLPINYSCTQNAEYLDGSYDDPINFTIDVYKPYIEYVRVSIDPQDPLYEMNWECNYNCEDGEDGIQPIGGIIDGAFVDQGDLDPASSPSMFVFVAASEPLQIIEMNVEAFTTMIPQNQISINQQINDRTWIFEIENIGDYITGGTANSGNSIQFTFTGEDYPIGNNLPNQLLNLEDYFHPDNPTENDNCVQIPYRIGNGQDDWSNPDFPSGQENAHHFTLLCTNDGEKGDTENKSVTILNGSCLFADFSYEIEEGGCSVSFTNQSIGNPDTFSWDFGDGNTSNEENPTHIFQGNGTFTVELTVGIDGTSAQSTYSEDIELEDPFENIATGISSSNCICSPGMDGSISVIINPDNPNDDLPVPFIIQLTSPEGEIYTVEVNDDAEWPQIIDFDELSLEGLYEIDITNAYGCETNFTYPVEKCGVVFPYIKRLMVDVTPGITVYDATWEVNGDCISYTGGSIPADINDLDNAGLDIYFFVTESLDLVETNVELIDLDFPVSSVTPELINSSQNQYKAIFPSGSAAAISGKQRIRIVGKTSAGKPLLDLRAMSNDLVDCVVIPQLSENCEVSTPIEKDKDDVHEFEIGCIHLSFDITVPSGQGAPDGAIDMTITGGGPLYQINWFNVNTNEFIASTEDISELKDGTYQVIVSDNNGCTVKSDEIHLASCGTKTLVATYNGDCSSDYEMCVKVIDAFGNTLNSDFNFHWSWEENGIEENSSEYGVSQSCLDASLGIIYDVKVDDLICGDLTLSDQFSITGYDQFSITSFINDACGTLASGMIQITVEGGLSPYQYNWSNGLSNSNSISGLNVGDYTVTVTDACQNTSSETYTVGTIPVDIEVNPIIVNSCSGGETGSINLEILGGFEPFNFEWNDDNNSTTQNIKNIPAGTYSVIITDLCENEFNYTFTVEESPNVTFQSTVAATTNQITGCNGQITITPNSNIGAPYTYAWSNGSTASQITNACAGNQTVTITDDFGCESILEFDVPVDCQPISISTSIQHAENCNDGFIKFNSFSNGIAPFSFEWSPEVTVLPNGAGDLTPGEYALTITDALGCSSIQVFQINGLVPGFDPIILFTTDACEGISNGSAEALVNNSGNFIIEWSNGANEWIVENLMVGTYYVTVTNTDNPECIYTDEVVISEVPIDENFSIELEVKNTCDLGENGKIKIIPIGGNPEYTFEIDGSNLGNIYFNQLENEYYNLPQGTYTISATDHCGIVATASVEIVNNPELHISGEVSDYCNEENAGAINLDVNGGTPPYNYDWSIEAENSPNIAGLNFGSYCVTVTDENGCTISDCYEIYSPMSIIPGSFFLNHATTNNSGDGSISWDFSGGETFSFQWEGPNDFTSTDEDLSNLSAGEYNVSITNNNGCEVSGLVIIYSCKSLESESIPPFSVGSNFQSTSNAETNDGSITLQASGGLGFYSYQWSGPIDNLPSVNHIENLIPGEYCYTVTDGCNEESDCIDILDCEGFNLDITYEISQCNSINSDGNLTSTTVIRITDISGGDGDYELLWANNQPVFPLSAYNYWRAVYIGNTTGSDIELAVRIFDGTGCSEVETITLSNISNGTTSTQDCIYQSPISIEGNVYYTPTHCLTQTLCDGTVIGGLLEPIEKVTTDNFNGSCNIQLYCGDEETPFQTAVGQTVSPPGLFHLGSSCYMGTYCEVLDFDLNNSCQQEVTSAIRETLNTTAVFQVETSYACDPDPPIGQLTELDWGCVEVTYCGGDILSEEYVDHSYCQNIGFVSCSYPPDNYIVDSGINEIIPLGLKDDLFRVTNDTLHNLIFPQLDEISFFLDLNDRKEVLSSTVKKIYPNPFQESLNIELNPNEKIKEVKIILYNILGEMIIEKNASLSKEEKQTITLDLSQNISKGLYELIILDENGAILHSEKVVHLQ